MTHTTKVLAALALVIACAGSAPAGSGNRTGTNGASELLIPVGARDIGLGGSSIATSSGVEALYWNPAAVARMKNSAAVYVSHMSYIADIGVNYGAVSTQVEGVGVFSLSLKSLTIGDIPVTTTLDPDGTGQAFSPQFFTIGLTYSRQLSDRIAVGITGNLVTERMGDVSATGVAFNVGVAYGNLGGLEGVNLAVVVKNIGPQMRYDGSGLLAAASGIGMKRPAQFYQVQAASFELPTSIEFGIGYRRPLEASHVIEVSTAFQSNNFADDEYRLGLEYGYQELFFLRGGYNFAQKEEDKRTFLFGPSFGAGIHSLLGGLEVSVDYAYRTTELFDGNHVFSVKLGF